ncbi:MAG TPA: IS481 family transposase [Acidimicrobiales bacterium]|nr:IS481 family transposase [Acidimicrobiales bacterium]
MDLARYAVDCVVLENRSLREVASSVGMSKTWVAKQVSSYRLFGYEALGQKKRGPQVAKNQTPPEVEDEIVAIRKYLVEEGYDAGARTIAYHVRQRCGVAPSVSTVHRVLSRRGFVTLQPQKRPRSSWIRFEADLPNETWQTDMTHWQLADDKGVEIINFIDDYSRLVLSSVVVSVATAPDVVAQFYKSAAQYGFPMSVLSDNGCIFTAHYRGGRTGMETELYSLGITFKHGKPYHPQTQGKVERYHQTLKKWLRRQRPANSIAELQRDIDRFVRYYNEVRPHQAKECTPLIAWNERDKAVPTREGIKLTPETRVRHDRIDSAGKFTLRYKSKLHHIGVGRPHRGKRIIVLIADCDIRVMSTEGELLRKMTLDPSKIYQRL